MKKAGSMITMQEGRMNRIGTTAEFAAIYAQAKGIKCLRGQDVPKQGGSEFDGTTLPFIQQCSIDKRSKKIAAIKYKRRNGLTGRYN